MFAFWLFTNTTTTTFILIHTLLISVAWNCKNSTTSRECSWRSWTSICQLTLRSTRTTKPVLQRFTQLLWTMKFYKLKETSMSRLDLRSKDSNRSKFRKRKNKHRSVRPRNNVRSRRKSKWNNSNMPKLVSNSNRRKTWFKCWYSSVSKIHISRK